MSERILLQGVVGSQAYGLAHKDSDTDRLGIYVANTLDVAGLRWTSAKETLVTKGPEGDITMHEVGKYIRLALKANPTILELMWLPKYEIQCEWTNWLIENRREFLSTRAVANAYIGYAKQQAVRLAARGDSFSADTRKRTAKHGRHMLRLMRQGAELLATGELTIRVPDPAIYLAFDHMTPEEMLDRYQVELAIIGEAEENSVLPEEPNFGFAETYLREVRKGHIS